MLFAVDSDSKKVTYQAVVSKDHLSKGFKATDWTSKVGVVLNGRAGGKEDASQGAGTAIDKIEDAIIIAKNFAKLYI